MNTPINKEDTKCVLDYKEQIFVHLLDQICTSVSQSQSQYTIDGR
jgi:hypothetical protein